MTYSSDRVRVYHDLREKIREAESVLYLYRDGHYSEKQLCESLQHLVLDQISRTICRIGGDDDASQDS